MLDDRGRNVDEAGPSTPVEILGLDGVPDAGDQVNAAEDDKVAKQVVEHRRQQERKRELGSKARISLEGMMERNSEGASKELKIVLKADVSGSLEAFEDEIARLPQEEVQVSIITSGVGGITESDVMLASASDAIIIGFNVRPLVEARRAAEREGVEIRTYAVIYKALDDLRDAMQGLLAPEEVEETIGDVEVRQTFRASKIGTIAGSYVTDGTIRRGAPVRIVREGRVVYTGKIGSLRRFQDDVREVSSGYECGITIEGYQDVKEGDVFEVFETRQVEREL